MRRTTILATVIAVAIAVPALLQAHRQWMLPSSTILSKADSWITVDAAVSNELFYFDHVPMRLASIVITGPGGETLEPQNASTGKYRSTFDVHLAKLGTYKIASVSNMTFAAWKENGAQKTWRGEEAALKTEVPQGAEDLTVTRVNNRIEVFATAGQPDTKALATTGVGLELVPVTHPNDLVDGEAATFQFVYNGKPAAGLEVAVIPGGIRYRDQLHEQKIVTGPDGKFSVTFPEPGMYWLNASVGGGRGPGGPGGPGASGAARPAGAPGGPRASGGPGGPGGRGAAPTQSRANYVATLEVMPQ